MGKYRVPQAHPDLLAVDIGQESKLWVEANPPVPAAKQTNLRRPRGEVVRAREGVVTPEGIQKGPRV